MDKEIFLTETQVAKMTKFALPTLRNWRFRKEGPPYFKIGKSVRYGLHDLLKFMAEHRINPEA